MPSVAASLGAMNMLLVVVCSLIAVSAFIRLRSPKRLPAAARVHTIGLILFAGGWALHRLYWAVNRSIEAMGHDFLLTYIYKSSSWITLIPMVAIVAGAGMILAPVMEAYFEDHWFLVYVAFTTAVWSATAIVL